MTFEELEKLEADFNQLKTSTTSLISLEQAKVQYLKALKAHLDTSPLIAPLENVSKLKQGLKKLGYYLLLLLGLIENGIGTYLFVYNVLLFLIHPIVIAISILVTLLSCILFYAFEAEQLKEAFGFETTAKDRSSLVQIHLEQIELLKNINECFSKLNFNPEAHKDYDVIFSLIKSLNQDIEDKKTAFRPHQESLVHRMLRYSVITFGGLLTAAGTYYMAISLLGAVVPALLGTPVGWALIGLLIIAGVAFYLSMQGKGMAHLINPDLANFDKLKVELDQFDDLGMKLIERHNNNAIENGALKKEIDVLIGKSNPYSFYGAKHSLKQFSSSFSLGGSSHNSLMSFGKK